MRPGGLRDIQRIFAAASGSLTCQGAWGLFHIKHDQSIRKMYLKPTTRNIEGGEVVSLSVRQDRNTECFLRSVASGHGMQVLMARLKCVQGIQGF
jgi:hypothetical protein